jgi:endonuclease YncB( thermonuclease family)
MIQFPRRNPGEVIRVIDGDTFECLIDTGFRGYTKQRIRIANLWCPGLKEPGGQEAKSYLGGLLWAPILNNRRPLPLAIESYKYGESFERWVAAVYVVSLGEKNQEPFYYDVAFAMIEAGHGSATKP